MIKVGRKSKDKLGKDSGQLGNGWGGAAPLEQHPTGLLSKLTAQCGPPACWLAVPCLTTEVHKMCLSV